MALERTRWTDDRLDDLGGRMNEQYAEILGRLDRIDGRLDRLEDKVDRLRTEFYNTRLWMFTSWLGLAAIFVEIALRT